MKLGIILILLSAIMTCSGQLCWKLGAIYTEFTIGLYLAGFFLDGFGALMMTIAFRFGEMSVLHPMLSSGFVGSLFLGSVFLKEAITLRKIVGILAILIGIFLLSSQKEEEYEKVGGKN